MLRSPTMVLLGGARVRAVRDRRDDRPLLIGHRRRFAVLRTWLYIARFGPTETSYHDMNHSPGTLSGMLS